MFEKFVTFLKNTFTYEEESEAETPSVARTDEAYAPQEKPRERKRPEQRRERPEQRRTRQSELPSDFQPRTVVDPEQYFSPVANMTSPRRQADSTPQPKYATDPLTAAKQQTDNFSALRPRPEDTQFRMIVEKVFYAKGGGVVVRGNIGVGIARADSKALIVHAANRTTAQTRVVAIERDGKVVNTAPAGSTVGLLLDTNITRNDVHAGDVIGSI